MLTSESEAYNKWCFMARCSVFGVTANRNDDPDKAVKGTRCIGSRCMAWRWGSADSAAFRDKEGGGEKVATTLEELALMKDDPEHWEELGRCGLAGGL